ncbi:FtsX-like permease family protein [Actinomadura sp. CNU-125]|uniref:FtsX-like permease family protein n=1 Tax=Actinomadura sp. CNU-125 TaxID=1904961 RepID=UPI0021CD0058|nr:ABC transporter permease [Actinomadura sp. CNU-125]
MYLVHVNLTESDAASIVRWRETVFTPDRRDVYGATTRNWQTVLRTDLNMIHGSQPSLVVGGWLLAVAATVTLAALAAVRAARDNRRAGLLKAVGAGPGTVAAVLLAQYLLLTAVATALGLAAGSLAAPGLADPSAGLLDTAGPPSTAIVVAAAVLGVLVAVAGTLGPVLRAARTSTVAALAAPAHPHAHHPWVTAVTAYLPTSLLVGVRLLVRRPGRAVLTFVGTAATAVTVTAMLGYRTAVATDPGTGLTAAAMEAVNDRNAQVILGITLALAALSAVNTVFLGWSAAVQARRSLAVTRTLGATPGQVVAAICTAQLLPAVPALLVGAPSGSVLLWLVGGRLVTPPGSWLLAAAAVILLAAAALTALPAWLQARGPAGRALDAGPA